MPRDVFWVGNRGSSEVDIERSNFEKSRNASPAFSVVPNAYDNLLALSETLNSGKVRSRL